MINNDLIKYEVFSVWYKGLSDFPVFKKIKLNNTHIKLWF